MTRVRGNVWMPREQAVTIPCPFPLRSGDVEGARISGQRALPQGGARNAGALPAARGMVAKGVVR
jgi:hypothetical protein